MAIAIIAEYNPFHNGHIHQLKELKKRFPNEEVVIIMSGKYVQRGEIAIMSFKDREAMAKKYGANRVLELPFEYATQAAHIFAEGAMKIVHELNIDKIFFGSESNDPELLMKIAQTIYDHEDEYNALLKKYLKEKGNSFPKSSSLALEEITNNKIIYPNDILGLEYCKAIVRNDYKIRPYTIKRTVAFHSEDTNNEFASASHIRKLISKGKDYSKYTPAKINPNYEKIEDHYETFQKIVLSKTPQEIAEIKMISEGMENLFKKHIHAKSMDEFISLTNSRRYTSSRIKRTILYVVLGIKK